MSPTMIKIFDTPNLEKTIKDWKIADLAVRDAKNGLPASASTEVSSSEKKIRNDVISLVVAKEAKNAQEALASQHKQRSSLHITETLSNIKTAPNKLHAELGVFDTNEKPKLISAIVDELSESFSYNYFKMMNHLKHEPKMLDSQVLHLAIIGLIALLETILNGFFLQRGSELGLIGGIGLAAMITALNLGMAFIFGNYCLNNLWHNQLKFILFGVLMLIIQVALLSIFSLFVGHYRAALEGDMFIAASEAVITFRSGIFEITDFNAWILVAVSFSVGVSLTIKFLTKDDIYPGYGENYRAYKKAEKEVELKQSEYTNSRLSIVNNAENNLNELERNSKIYLIEYQALLQDSEKLIKGYSSFLDSCSIFNDSLISEYRKLNKELRPTHEPRYFNDRALLDMSSLEQLDVLTFEKDSDILPGLKEKLLSLDSFYESSLDIIQDVRSANNIGCNNFIEALTKEAHDRFTGSQRT